MLDEVEGNYGSIDPKLIKEANPDFKPTGAARKVFRSGGQPADVAAEMLARTGHYKGDPGQVDQFAEALNDAARARTAYRQGNAKQTKLDRQDEAFARDRGRPGPDQKTVISDDLQPGDTIKLRGTPLKVRELEFDQDGMVTSVTLDDGAKYGTQVVRGGVELKVDKWSHRKSDAPVVTWETAEGTEKQKLAAEGQKGEARPSRSAIESFLDKAIEATNFDPTHSLEGVTGAPVWMTKALANGTLRAVRAAYRTAKTIAEAIDAGLAWLREQGLKDFDEQAARSWIEGQTGQGGDPALSRLRRLEEITERLGAISAAAQRPGGLTPAVKDERISLRREMKEIRQTLARDPEHVRDLIRRLDQIGTELQRARKAGNGAHSIELGEEFQVLASEIDETVPKKLFWELTKELVESGEINKLSGWDARGPSSGPSMSEPGAEPGARPAAVGTPGVEPGAAPPRRRDAARLPGAMEQLPENLRNAYAWANTQRRKLSSLWTARKERDQMATLKDAADNISVVIGRQTRNVVLHELNRAFGARTRADLDQRNALREMALTFVVESGAGVERAGVAAGAGRQMLDDFRGLILASEHANGNWAKKALAAISYADEHWDKLAQVAKTYQTLTDWQNQRENEQGIKTLYRKGGYVFHLQDANKDILPPDSGGGYSPDPQSPGAPFRHKRDYKTYAESIAAGVAPKTLNAVDLMETRTRLGERLIQLGGWVDALREVMDPTSQTPIVTELNVEARADGTLDITAPVGYERIQFAGRDVAVQQGYSSLFRSLTTRSFMPHALMKGVSTAKHLVLLFDTYHLGRLAFWNAVARAGAPTYRRGLTLLDTSEGDIRAMARNGEIAQPLAARLLTEKSKLNALLQGGLNVGSVKDNLHAEWIQKLPIAGGFNKWLFEQYQRGAMTEVAVMEFDKLRKARPDLSESQAARQAAKDVNVRFGNLGSQGWIKSKGFQDLARLVFLAPQWNESLIRSEVGAVKQLAGSAAGVTKGRFSMGLLARSVGTAAVGQFVANQIINYFTRGKPTWENPEEETGAKLSAWIPDTLGNGPGYFLNPMSLPLEISHQLWKVGQRSGGDPTKALQEYLVGRLASPLARPAYVLLARKDTMGRSLRGGKEVGLAMLEAGLPLPLSGSAAYRAGKQLVTGEHEEAYAGQFQKQLMQTFGIKTDQAPSAEQRIRGLANEFRREQPDYKPQAEFYGGDYDALKHALFMGNMRDAGRALADLRLKRTEAQIARYMAQFVRHPFTGSVAGEKVFLGRLSEEQSQTYDRAVSEREAIQERFLQLLEKHPAAEPAQAAAFAE